MPFLAPLITLGPYDVEISTYWCVLYKSARPFTHYSGAQLPRAACKWAERVWCRQRRVLKVLVLLGGGGSFDSFLNKRITDHPMCFTVQYYMTIDIGWTTNKGKCKTLNILNFQHLKYHDLTCWVRRVVTNQNLYSPSLYLPTAPLLEDAGEYCHQLCLPTSVQEKGFQGRL